MKKGDLKKQEILNTAEDLFCRKGYEQTSVQDILDRLNSSKGSFYHHFASKEALLEAICGNRAAQIFRTVSAEMNTADSLIGKLDILLSGMIPFRDEKLAFLMMLFPVFSLPEGRIVRQYYCDAISEQFRLSLIELIHDGSQSGMLFCTDPEPAASIILSMINDLWTRICNLIINAEGRDTEPDLSECFRITESCRLCICRFLSLPYGSVRLIDIPVFRLLIEQIHKHWDQSRQS